MFRLRTLLALGALSIVVLGTNLAQAGGQNQSGPLLPTARIVFQSWYRCPNDVCSKPNYSIAVVNPNGTGFHRLTHDDTEETGPAWSPDRRWIAFDRAGGHPGRIWVMNASGRHQHQLTTAAPAYQYEPDWSPNGKTIVFTDETKDLWTVNVRTGKTTRLTRTAASEWSPAWSPDGKKIAFASNRSGDSIQIWALTLRTHQARQLTGLVGVADSQEPAWSPDGHRIAFRRSSGIFVMKADGSHVHALPTGIAAGHPSWSPDGRWIAYEQQPQPLVRMNVMVIRPDGTGRRNVTVARARWQNLSPDW